MKTCIVTVYDSVNCGSYWQARALGIMLRKIGCKVVYKKSNRSKTDPASRKMQMRIFASYCKHGKIDSAFRYASSIMNFIKMQQKMKIVCDVDDIDCFVLGSDTIWDLNRDHFANNSKVYWGIEFFPKKVISYAACAANTNANQITPELHEAIGKMYAVLVRDQHTFNLICDDSRNEPHVVCDPTLLLTKKEYQRYIQNNKEKKRYVFLYLNEPLSLKHIKELKDFCKKKDIEIINGLTIKKPDYCDKSIIVEPNRFLTYMYYADYVVTDTFHGTVFSVNFNKQFVSINKDKNKVRDFLDLVGLEGKLVNEDENIIEKLNSAVDFNEVNPKVNRLRKSSMLYLKQSILE